MQIVTSWMKEGIVIGRQEGEAFLMLQWLTKRVGQLTERTVARIRSLPVASLEALCDALFDFTSEADVVIWLDQFSQSN